MLPGPPTLAALRLAPHSDCCTRPSARGAGRASPREALRLVLVGSLLSLLLPGLLGAAEETPSEGAPSWTASDSVEDASQRLVREGTYDASDPDANRISEESLLANERFWPYHVNLLTPRTVEGAPHPIQPVIPGVLVRVEEGSVARIDFGRRGKVELPVSETNIVEQANRVRLGEVSKMAPNFVLAVANRLYESESGHTRPYRLDLKSSQRDYLCVFADPESKGFAKVAASLAPLQQRENLLTILFQQTTREHPLIDPAVGKLLRKQSWPVAFSFSTYAEPFRRSLLGAEVKLPYVLLQTEEGRVLFEGPWHEGIASQLGTALAARDRARSPQRLGSVGAASQ